MTGVNNSLGGSNKLNDVDISLIVDTLRDVLKNVTVGSDSILPRDIVLASSLASLKLSGALLGTSGDESNMVLHNNDVNWNEICGYNFSKKTKDSISALFLDMQKLCKPCKPPIAVSSFDLMKSSYKKDKRFDSEGNKITFYSESKDNVQASVIGTTEVSTFLDVDKFKDSFIYTCFEDYYDEMQKSEYLEAFKKININAVLTYQLKVEIYKQYLKDVEDPKVKTFVERLDRFLLDYIDHYRGQDGRYLLDCINVLPTCPDLAPQNNCFEDVSESEYKRISNLKFKLNGKFISGDENTKKPSKLIESKIREYDNLDPKFRQSTFAKYVFLNYLQTGNFDVSKNGVDSESISRRSMASFNVDHDFYDMLADILFEKSKKTHDISGSFYLYWFDKMGDDVLDQFFGDNADKISIFKYIRPINDENKSKYDAGKVIKIDYVLKSKAFYEISDMGTSNVIVNTDPNTLISPLCISSYPLGNNGVFSKNDMNATTAFYMKVINPCKLEDTIWAYINGSLQGRGYSWEYIEPYFKKGSEKYKDFNGRFNGFHLNFNQYSGMFDSGQNVFTFPNNRVLAEPIDGSEDLPVKDATRGYVIYHICLTILISIYVYCVFMQNESIVFITNFMSEFESIREGLLSNDSKSMDSSNFTYGLVNSIEKIFHNENSFVVSQGYTHGVDNNKKNNGVKSALLKFPKELYFKKDDDSESSGIGILDNVAVLYVTTRISDRNYPAQDLSIKCSEGYVFKQKGEKLVSEFIPGSEDCLPKRSLWNIDNDSDLYLLIKGLEKRGVKDIIYVMDSPYSSSTAYADKDSFIGFNKELFSFLSENFNINFIPLYTSEYQIFSNNVNAIIKGLQDRFLNNNIKPSPSSILPIFAFELGSGGLSGNNKSGYKNGRLYKTPYNYYEGRTGECVSELLTTGSLLNTKVMLALMFLHYITNEKANSPYGKNNPFSNLKDRIMSNTTNGYDISNKWSVGLYDKNYVKINHLSFVKLVWDVINKKDILGGD